MNGATLLASRFRKSGSSGKSVCGFGGSHGNVLISYGSETETPTDAEVKQQSDSDIKSNPVEQDKGS